MTLHTLLGTPQRQDEILDQFFDDLGYKGWEAVGEAMHWVQLMEVGRCRYYIVGSRAMGCSHERSDLDILVVPDGKWDQLWQDFKLGNEMRPYRYYIDFRESGYDGSLTPPTGVWGLFRLDKGSVEIQIREDAKDWRRVWETVLQRYLDHMRSYAKLSKKERRANQTFIMKKAAFELGIYREPPPPPYDPKLSLTGSVVDYFGGYGATPPSGYA